MATVIRTGIESHSRKRRPPTASNDVAGSDALKSLVEGEIIPRLLVAHAGNGANARSRSSDESASIDRDEARQFAALTMRMEADELLAEVEQYLARGVSVESVFIDLLAPSARKLGEYWEEDRCDFVDVTMGLWRLQEVMRALAMREPGSNGPTPPPRAALFSPMPGEQHSFGALMLDEVFARAGWESEALIEPTRKQLLRQVADRSFDMVGLTVSCDCPSGAISDLITALRSVSRNPAVHILIGGRLVNSHPDLVEQTGADGTAVNAVEALDLAESMVTTRPALLAALS